jgi:hypothetical protein
MEELSIIFNILVSGIYMMESDVSMFDWKKKELNFEKI